MTGGSAAARQAYRDKIVLGESTAHLETKDCPSRVASRKKIEQQRQVLDQLEAEAAALEREIEHQKKKKNTGRKRSMKKVKKKKGGRGRLRPEPLGFDYNGMPIYYEENPGEHGVSTAFDNFMRLQAERQETINSWQKFSEQKQERVTKQQREQEERDFIHNIEQRKLRDVFDEFEAAHENNWDATPVIDWQTKETREDAHNFMAQYSNSMPELAGYSSQQYISKADNSFLADIQKIEQKQKQLQQSRNSTKPIVQPLEPPKQKKRHDEANRPQPLSRIPKLSVVNDSSKLHACYRVGQWSGKNKNTYSLGSSSKHAASMVSLRQAERRLAEMQRKQLEANQRAAEKEVMADAMQNARRWKHLKQADKIKNL